jgi:hypothetical protein
MRPDLIQLSAAPVRNAKFPHAGKVVMEASAGLLALVCSETGAEISTGALYSGDDLRRVHGAKLMLYCKLCRKTHLFRFADARLRPVRLD